MAQEGSWGRPRGEEGTESLMKHFAHLVQLPGNSLKEARRPLQPAKLGGGRARARKETDLCSVSFT